MYFWSPQNQAISNNIDYYQIVILDACQEEETTKILLKTLFPVKEIFDR